MPDFWPDELTGVRPRVVPSLNQADRVAVWEREIRGNKYGCIDGHWRIWDFSRQQWGAMALFAGGPFTEVVEWGEP